MALALLIAGIFAVVAGLLAVLFGISIKEFSLGNTLILSGTVGVCSGMLLVGLHAVVLELKALGRRLASAAVPTEVRVRPVLPPGIAPAPMSAPEAGAVETRFESSLAPLPWQDEAVARERQRADAPPVPEAPPSTPEAPRRRNLLFQSTSRKERERAQAKTADGQSPEAAEPPPASFDDAWPKSERMRSPEPALPRRQPSPPRPAPTFTDAVPPAAGSEPADEPAVTVLKSGIVDGMAYSLYSDGSIEAQMPEGMMRFASIDELRAHLDQRS
jgi:hypothetical protein